MTAANRSGTEPLNAPLTAHSPEPWRAIKSATTTEAPKFEIVHSGFQNLAHINHFNGDDEANACRIVACVNACEGLPQAALDGGWTAAGLSKHAKKMELEVYDLRTALEEIAAYEQRGPVAAAQLIAIARAALKAKP